MSQDVHGNLSVNLDNNTITAISTYKDKTVEKTLYVSTEDRLVLLVLAKYLVDNLREIADLKNKLETFTLNKEGKNA